MKKIVTSSLALASVVLLSGCSMTGQEVEKEDAMMEKEAVEKNDSMMKQEDVMIKGDDAMMKKDEAMEKGDAMVKEENGMMVKQETSETRGMYTDYSAPAVEAALASGKKVVLFFHAPWCPTCKSADSTLSQEKLSSGTIVFKTDYDSNIELKRKYGVTYQHTFVSLNSDGTMMKKASGISTAAEVAELF